jgi:tetratricopeptide (TPR) repeat protein
MYVRAVETSPYNPNYLYNLAMTHYQLNADAPALEMARRAVGARANFSEAHYLQGLAHRRRGETRESFRALQRAHRFGLKDPRFLLDFMLAADGVGEEKIALDVARDLAASQDPQILRETARLHLKYGEFNPALARLQALARLPECNFEDLKLYVATALAADQNVMSHIGRLTLKPDERRELIAYYEGLRNERIEALAPRDPVARSRYRP